MSYIKFFFYRISRFFIYIFSYLYLKKTEDDGYDQYVSIDNDNNLNYLI